MKTTIKDDVEDKKDELSGVDPDKNETFTILEAHVHLEIEGFEDIDPKTNESTGVKFPYIVTWTKVQEKS